MSTAVTMEINIRVVDPRPDDYSALAAELKAADCEMLFATSGDEALRLPSSSSAGLWLINFKLPDMTGAELLATVRSRDPRSACVLVSDVYSASDEIAARQLGATLFCSKPLQLQMLYSLSAFHKPNCRDHFAHGPPSLRMTPTDTALPGANVPNPQGHSLNQDPRTLPTQE